MTRVRRHTRQLPSGKTATVRQHERSVQPAGRDERDDWWDRPQADPQDVPGDYPAGTWFFRQDDDIFAVHPDGTVRPVEDDGADPEDAPPGPATRQDERPSRDAYRSGPHDDDDDDAERYWRRVEQLDSSPDPVGLMESEQLARNSAQADAAARRLIAEALLDQEES